jgi:hypothetical protein
MTINTNEIRLVIRLEGGLAHAVYVNCSTPIRVVIQDLDVEGADADEIAVLEDDTEFVGIMHSTIENAELVSSVFKALGEDVPAIDKQQANYLVQHGQCCPNCGSRDIEANVVLDADGLTAKGQVGCSNCDSTWKDQYRLIGFTDLDATPLYVIRSVSERGYWSNDKGWVLDVASATKLPENTAFVPNASGKDAVYVDAKSAKDFLSNELSIGDEVLWNDPDDRISSGVYTIVDIPSGKLLHQDDICTIKNAHDSEVEVFAHELS